MLTGTASCKTCRLTCVMRASRFSHLGYSAHDMLCARRRITPRAHAKLAAAQQSLCAPGLHRTTLSPKGWLTWRALGPIAAAGARPRCPPRRAVLLGARGGASAHRAQPVLPPWQLRRRLRPSVLEHLRGARAPARARPARAATRRTAAGARGWVRRPRPSGAKHPRRTAAAHANGLRGPAPQRQARPRAGAQACRRLAWCGTNTAAAEAPAHGSARARRHRFGGRAAQHEHTAPSPPARGHSLRCTHRARRMPRLARACARRRSSLRARPALRTHQRAESAPRVRSRPWAIRARRARARSAARQAPATCGSRT
mmetsp:Transcript_16263/g.42134  ORF Transcript_16263/g.42134 Transcript_16263/m.42134 type:complete len:314 (+) Transcript_16263:88-1029(+)